MEIAVSEYEPMIREFLEVESLVIAGYAQEYASEVYCSSEDSDGREIARRNFFVCMFGLVDRSGLESQSDRCDFLNQKATEISRIAAEETGMDTAYTINDSPFIWAKRKRELFAAMSSKGHVKKDEYSFSVFVSMHEDREKHHHDLIKKVV